VVKRDFLGRRISADDLPQYSLLVSDESIVMSHPDRADIIINRKWFSGERWNAIVGELDSLPFRLVSRS
jgi:hypothetical protein